MSIQQTTARRRLIPWRLVIEPRLQEVPRWMPPLVSLGAIVAALIVGAMVLSQSSEAARRRPPAVQIGPGETALIPVEFRPAAAEAYAETLTLPSNDPDESSVTVRLLGVGTP